MNLLCVTIGDPCGIGPEVALNGCLDYLKSKKSRLLLIGSAVLLKEQAQESGLEWYDSWVIKDREKFSSKPFQIFSPHDLSFEDLERGKDSLKAGHASLLYLQTALDFIDKKKSNALVTAPISKKSWTFAGAKECGHTEFLAEYSKVSFCMMAFFSKILKIGLLTRHLPLSQVSKHIKKFRVLRSIRFIHQELKKYLLLSQPKIAVSGLNPHSGESGCLGMEEIEEIFPAIQEAQREGINVEGPFSADTLFVPQNLKKYDFFLMMYHDQGLIPFKTLDFERGVNVTLGLPFVRTSVDHGTAYNIVGKRMANKENMIEAIRWADQLAK